MTLQPLLPVAWVAVVAVGALLLAGTGLVRGPHRWRWAVRALAVLAGAGMLLGPATPRHVTLETTSAVDVFLVVDRTGSMAAEDWGAGRPRLDGVRHDVRELARALPGARFSVLSWDSEAVRQLPLTTDTRALESWAQTVRQEVTAWSTGSSVDRAVEPLTTALERSAERHPDHLRLVVVLTDGERTVEAERRSFAPLAGLVDGGAVLGYGTAEGGPMREYDGSVDPDPDAPWIPDPDDPDRPALSRADEAELRALADELGVPYLHRTGPDDGVRDVVADVDPAQVLREARSTRTTWSPVLWPFAAVVTAAMLVELAVSVVDLQGRRRGGAR